MDSSKKPYVVKQRKVLGLSMYRRQRTSEHAVTFHSPDKVLSYPGLHALGKFWDSKLKTQEVTAKQHWGQILQEAIALSLLSMVWKGEIEVCGHVDQVESVFGMFRHEESNYTFHQRGAFTGGDLLSKRLHDQIGLMEQVPLDRQNLNRLVARIFKSYIGTKLQNRADRVLMMAIWGQYDKGYPWVQVKLAKASILSKKMLTYQIDTAKGESLAKDFAMMERWLENHRQGKVLAHMLYTIAEAISNEVETRVPSND